MKSSLRFWTAIVAAAISFSAMTSLRAVDMATPATKQEVQEDLGYDNYKGKSHKIARVYYVTPVAVQVIYEGEKGGIISRATTSHPNSRSSIPMTPKPPLNSSRPRRKKSIPRPKREERRWNLGERTPEHSE